MQFVTRDFLIQFCKSNSFEFKYYLMGIFVSYI